MVCRLVATHPTEEVEQTTNNFADFELFRYEDPGVAEARFEICAMRTNVIGRVEREHSTSEARRKRQLIPVRQPPRSHLVHADHVKLSQPQRKPLVDILVQV